MQVHLKLGFFSEFMLLLIVIIQFEFYNCKICQEGKVLEEVSKCRSTVAASAGIKMGMPQRSIEGFLCLCKKFYLCSVMF